MDINVPIPEGYVRDKSEEVQVRDFLSGNCNTNDPTPYTMVKIFLKKKSITFVPVDSFNEATPTFPGTSLRYGECDGVFGAYGAPDENIQWMRRKDADEA